MLDFNLSFRSQFRSAWKRFLDIPGLFPDGSPDANVTTSVSKWMASKKELVQSTNTIATIEVDQQTAGFVGVQNEDRRQEDSENYECNLEMTTANSSSASKCTKSDIGDVSL